jgi:protein TonB
MANGKLDPGPTPLSEIEPEYPEAAGSLRGTVTLRLLISDKGTVDDASVVRSAPPGVFDAAAVVAFKSALFSPGRLLGVPVKSQVTIEVDFTPVQRSDLSARKY